MQLKDGHTYHDRIGEVITVRLVYEGEHYPFRGADGRRYMEDGRYCDTVGMPVNDYDLIGVVDDFLKESQLEDGLIPPSTPCPFRTRCEMSGGCEHTGTEHVKYYSCAAARGFELLDERRSAKYTTTTATHRRDL